MNMVYSYTIVSNRYAIVSNSNSMFPYALERDMAIKIEKISYSMLMMGMFQSNRGYACNDMNFCLERTKENAFNISNEWKNDEKQLKGNDAQEHDNTWFKKLPRPLLLQLGNCGIENKTLHLFVYLSPFAMVQLGFLMVRHTLEDIDA